MKLAAALVAAALIVSGCTGSSSGDEPSSATTSTARSTSTSTPGREPTDGVVPDVVGDDVPAAIEGLRDAGFGDIEALDATGEQRIVDVAEEDSWVVSDQSAPAGSAVDPARKVVLFVHREGENPRDPDALGFGSVPDVLYAPAGDAATAMTDAGFASVTFVDFAGEDRAVAADDSWVVTAQTPAPESWLRTTETISLQALPADETPGA